MRLQGKVETWNDEKGYGFVEQMIAQVRTPRGREPEPAHIFTFTPDQLKVS